MANMSSLHTLCNATAIIHHELRKHRCETEMNQEAAHRYGINAGFYVIVVILFYGTSVMLLIASHIKRHPKKISEDKQIDNYLKEFQVVRESSSKDNYRKLKRNMIDNLRKMGMLQEINVYNKNATVSRCLSKTLLPTTAVALRSSLTHGDDWMAKRIYIPNITLNSIKECDNENGINAALNPMTPHHIHCQSCPVPMNALMQNGKPCQAKVHKTSQQEEMLYRQSKRIMYSRSTSVNPNKPHNKEQGHHNMHSEHISSV